MTTTSLFNIPTPATLSRGVFSRTASYEVFSDIFPAVSHEGVAVAHKTKHVCSASLNHKDTPWLTLNVKCIHTAWTNSNRIPLYKAPGSPITGDILLTLDKPEAIHAVKVSIRGTSSVASGGCSWNHDIHHDTFMDVTETLWSSSEGLPKFAELPPSGSLKDCRLQGKFTFPFALHLPRTIPLDSSHRHSESYPHPESSSPCLHPSSDDSQSSLHHLQPSPQHSQSSDPHSQPSHHHAQPSYHHSHPSHHHAQSSYPNPQSAHHRQHSQDSHLHTQSLHPDRHATCDLPGSWSSSRSPVAIDYDIHVTVVRGALKANASLSMNFYYAPHSRPDPPSVLRQKAYALDYPAPDPLSDPSGWHVVPPSKVKGRLSNGRSVEVVCTFALAKPLSYCRGKFIPVNLAVQCLDPSILDLLQSPLAVSIVLLQCASTGKNAHSEKHRFSRDVQVCPVARAQCWHPSTSAGDWDDCRTLMGEIALPQKMPATTISPKAAIQYYVVMLPFEVAGFTPSDPNSFVVDQRIRITTHEAEGPPASSQVPPGYVDPRKDHIDRFQNMMDAASMFKFR